MSLLFNTLSRGRKAFHYYHKDCLTWIAKHNIENNKSTLHKYCGSDYQKVNNNHRRCDGSLMCQRVWATECLNIWSNINSGCFLDETNLGWWTEQRRLASRALEVSSSLLRV